MYCCSRLNMSISCLLSTGLIFGPCYGRPAYQGDNEPISVEELGLGELGLDAPFKKMLKPVMDLTVNSGRQNMALVANQFIANLNKQCATNYTIDDGLYQTAVVLQKNGIAVQQNKFAYLKNLLQQSKKGMTLDVQEESDFAFGIELKKGKNKEFGNIDDMSDGEILGYVWILCGALLCIMPSGYTQALGGSAIVVGLQEVIRSGNEDAINRRKQ